MTEVLIIAAHPDDAELAVGGTIARLSNNGVDVTVAFATVSEPNPHHRHRRVESATRAADILGHSIHWIDSGRLDQVEDIPEYQLVRHIDQLWEQLRPATVLTHWDGDSHGDHVRVARAVVSSSRRWPATTLCQFGPNEHRTPRALEFVPNLFVPIGDHLDQKIKALRAYEYHEQGFRPLDLEWVQRQALMCGAQAGVPAAEALRVLRHRADPGSTILPGSGTGRGETAPK